MSGLSTIGFRNFRLNWKRNAFPTVLIGISTFVICSFLGYVEDVTSLFRDTYVHRSMYGHAILESEPSNDSEQENLLSHEEQKAIEEALSSQAEGIAGVVKMRRFSGQIETSSHNAYFMGLAYDLQAGVTVRGERFQWDTIAGEPLDDPFEAGIVLGRKLAPHLGCHAENTKQHLNGALGFPPEVRPFHCDERSMRIAVTTDRGSINAADFQVKGFVSTGFEEFDSHIVHMSLDQAADILGSEKLSSVNILFRDGRDHETLIQGLRESLEASGSRVRVSYWSDHKWADLFVRTVEWLGIFQNFVVAVVIVVAALSLSTTTMRSLVRRLPEIGTLRTMGYPGSTLMRIFLSEALLVAIAGSILGVGLSACVSLLLTDSVMSYQAGFLSDPVPFRIAFSLKSSLQASAFMSVLTVFTTWLTVRRAVKIPIVACFASSQS